MSYGELRRSIPDLSDKMLSERLTDLKAAGLVIASETGDRSRYRLTPFGDTLKPALEALYGWGEGASATLDVRFRSSPGSPP